MICIRQIVLALFMCFFVSIYFSPLLFAQKAKHKTSNHSPALSNGGIDGRWRQLNVKLEALVNVNCYGGNNGLIETKIIGGLKPYTIEWYKDSISFADTKDISNLTAGNYQLIVTDSKGSVKIVNYEITQPLPLKIVLESKRNPSCANQMQNGFIRLSVKGGSAPYRFEWKHNSDPVNTTYHPTCDHLLPGTYIITVIDSDGCKAEFLHILAHPQCP